MRTIKCVDVLLPKVAEPEKWAVVSCDQFTSQREYWKELESFVGDAPSALKLIFTVFVFKIDFGEDEFQCAGGVTYKGLQLLPVLSL